MTSGSENLSIYRTNLNISLVYGTDMSIMGLRGGRLLLNKLQQNLMHPILGSILPEIDDVIG